MRSNGDSEVSSAGGLLERLQAPIMVESAREDLLAAPAVFETRVFWGRVRKCRWQAMATWTSRSSDRLTSRAMKEMTITMAKTVTPTTPTLQI